MTNHNQAGVEGMQGKPYTRPIQRDAPEIIAALAAAAFVVLTGIWLALDSQVPDFDSGKHLLYALGCRDAIADGDVLEPYFGGDGVYPPLVHLVGAGGFFLGGRDVGSAVLAANIVFVPLLAAGAFLAGSRLAGAWGGALAAVFALGVPMIVSEFHSFLLDPPLTACVAFAVGCLLRSDGLRRQSFTVLFGVACALALLTKPTAAIFIAGPLVVVLARGAWRNPRGVLLAAAPVAVLAAPWYLIHLSDTTQYFQGATSGSGGSGPTGDDYLTPETLTARNWTWYGWSALNIQLLLPLVAFVVVGVVETIVHRVRDGAFRPGEPELLGGAAAGYVGVSLLSLHDPRYSLPLVVFAATLGTAWIVRLGRLGLVPATILVLVVVVNVVGVSFGVGDPQRVTVRSPAVRQGIFERQVTLYSPSGYVVNAPHEDGRVLDLLRSLKARGVPQVEIDPASAANDYFSPTGFRALASMSGLSWPKVYAPAHLGPRDAFFVRRPANPADPPPCVRLHDGTNVYVTLGNPVVPFEQYRLACPR